MLARPLLHAPSTDPPACPSTGPRRGRASRRVRTLLAPAAILLPAILLTAGIVPDPARAAPGCGLADRPEFAGHTLPLDGPPTPSDISTVEAFPALPAFTYPLFLTGARDGRNRLFVVEQSGRILTFPNDPAADASDLSVFLDLTSLVDFDAFSEKGLLGLAFDPGFASNGVLYVNYTAGNASCSPTFFATRVERIIVPEPGESAFVLDDVQRATLAEFCQPDVNHNGGMLAIGPDGMLYVASGDGGGDSSAAEDLSNPLGAILRIDPTDGSAPPDNPFVDTPGADPRIYHFGLRNPWRFSFDRAAPHALWIGDVGQSSREEISRVPASPGGLDFGWPDCEGTRDYAGSCEERGGVTPVIELPHVDAFSITGGYVYRGDALPDLRGLYFFGDYVTGNLWAWDRSSVDPDTGEAVLIDAGSVGNASSFGEDDAGELYVLDYLPGRIRTFTGSGTGGGSFPPFLSETGLFADTAGLTPAPGLVPYDVNAPLWSDRALKRRWLALPAGERVGFSASGDWAFPVGTVLVKHFDLPLGPGEVRRLETRLFVHQMPGWLGVTYRWNEAGTDATLLTEGFDETFTVLEDGQTFEQTWTYPSTSGCFSCHTAAAGRVLGVRTAQLNRDFPYPGGTDAQLHAWSCGDVLDLEAGEQPGLPRHPVLEDAGASRQARVRAHLDANCAMCHQPGGTAPGGIDLRGGVLLGDMNVIDVLPSQGDLGLPDARRVAPGAGDRSVLLARMQSLDPGLRMARGTRLVHAEAAGLVRDWIDADLDEPDSDEDGVPDDTDLCPGRPDPGQADRDGDGTGDACDPDDAADLVVVLLSGPARVEPGEAAAVYTLTRNAGLRTAPSSQVRIFLSADTTFEAGVDAPVGTCQTGAIPGGQIAPCTDPDVAVPLDLLDPPEQEATWYWLACADGLGVVDERDETDNCGVTYDPVMVPEPSGALLRGAGILALALVARRARGART